MVENSYTYLLFAFEAIRDFMELGGNVLFLIAILTFVMWALILERVIYFLTTHKENVRKAILAWESRLERKSWFAHRVRETLISQVSMKLDSSLLLIKSLVALCPLLGLLGTVTGMIEVFEVMAISGSGNSRAMAAGVSKATIPTMAGMVAALSGVFMNAWLHRIAIRERTLLNEHLTMDH
jgi:biopolymer transport protein ExbB